MASRWNRRVFVTVTNAERDAANAAAGSAAPDGGEPFRAPLAPVDQPGTVTHWCCEWAMQDLERAELLIGFRAQGLQPGDLDVVGQNGRPNMRKPLHLFDADLWPASAAMAAMGLEPAWGEE